MVEVIKGCTGCGRMFSLSVSIAGYFAWKRGEQLIQNALPDLKAEERELLITGICGKCFDALFREPVESREHV